MNTDPEQYGTFGPDPMVVGPDNFSDSAVASHVAWVGDDPTRIEHDMRLTFEHCDGADTVVVMPVWAAMLLAKRIQEAAPVVQQFLELSAGLEQLRADGRES